MAHVPYEVNVNRYICSELEQIRTMDKTKDFSALQAIVERIQYHASCMEDALNKTKNTYEYVKNNIDNDEVSDIDFRKEVKKKLKSNW